MVIAGGWGAVAGGSIWNATKNDSQAVMAYYDWWGATAWVALPDAESVEGVAMNSSWIYAAGKRAGTWSPPGTDIWIARYSHGGVESAVNIIPNPSPYESGALAIALDSSGSVYVAGYRTPYNPANPGYKTKNIWLAKYDPNLGLIWNIELDGPASSTDFASSLTLGPAGEVYLAGAVTRSGSYFWDSRDIWVARVNEIGAIGCTVWQVIMDGGENDNDEAWGVGVDANGSVWVTGAVDSLGPYGTDMWLGKFSSAGAGLDSYTADYAGGDDFGHAILINSSGPVVAGAFTDYFTGSSLFLAQFYEPVFAPVETSTILSAYPNPFRPGSGGPQNASEIVVRNIPAGAKVRFYTLAGVLVREVRDDNGDGKVSWDARNASGKDAGSGVYIYAVSAPGSGVKKGKVVIIR